MINKLHKTTLKILSLALALLLSQAALGMASLDLMKGGYLIPATPFDHNIASAIPFGGSIGTTLQHSESMESLFLKAKSIRYVADEPSNDYWQTPQQTEARWAGDCEDKAIWLFFKLKQNGFSGVRLVIGRLRSVSRGFHVWVTLSTDQNDSYLLDPTSQKRAWKSSELPEGYYHPLYSFDGSNRYRHDG